MNRLRAILIGAALLALAARTEAGGWTKPVAVDPQSGVSIEVTSLVWTSPLEGFVPCWVTIRNGSGAARSWDVSMSSGPAYGRGLNRSLAHQTVRVEDQTTARVPLLLPLSPVAGGYNRRESVKLAGYGIAENGTVTLDGSNASISSSMTGYIGLGDALAVSLWEPLKQAVKDAKGDLDGSPFQVDRLLPDWRAFSGFDCLWLTEPEYAKIDPEGRAAIRRWIDQGGIFYLCTQGLDPALRGGLGLAEDRQEGAVGYGSVRLIPWDGTALKVEEAVPLAQAIKPLHRSAAAGTATDWEMTRLVGKIPLNATFLILFIGAFAALAGPVNLFWLASARRRHRLFWTTPLISVAASLLLIAFILVQDGFGGRGARLMVTRLLPDRKEAAVTQEQVTRTGVLLSRGFTVSEDVVLSELAVRQMQGKNLEQTGRAFTGDWFASRSVQAQRLRAIVPSRAEIQLVSAAGAPPEVISSIPATLTDLQYIDAANRCWRGAGLRTGERVTLKPGERLTHESEISGSFQLAALQREAMKEPGSFYAVADDGPFLPTLGGIRWIKQRAVYLGPVSHP